MDAIEAIKLAYAGSHDWYQGTVSDLTPQAIDMVPDGVAQPIGYVAAHILHCEDVMINTALQGKPSVWERDGYGEKFGLPVALDMDTPAARAYKCDPLALNDYAKAVYGSTEAYLSTLRPEDLDKDMDLTAFGIGKIGLGTFLLTMLLGNNFAHTGEISALKGIAGAKGYPF